jgi:ABC-type branched-subunit amino acid transport system substrate-binding protein
MSGVRWVVGLGVLGVCLGATGGPSPSVRRGQALYMQGLRLSGPPLIAVVGEAEVPATTVPCVNCHGFDGRGRPESGITPPDITWPNLTKPYGHEHPDGRRHPPFTVTTLARALTEGFDPAGHPLHPVMPRYRMTADDVADLVAFLRVLDTLPDPGVTERDVRVGTVLPGPGPWEDIGQAMRRVLEAYFQDLNAQGGVFGRRVLLRTVTFSEASEIPEAFRRLLQDGAVFAVVGAFTGPADEDIVTMAAEARIPVIGAWTPTPRGDDPTNRYVFYLLPDLADQVRAGVKFVLGGRRGDSSLRIAVVYEPKTPYADITDLIERGASLLGWTVLRQASPEDGGSRLRSMTPEVVLFLGELSQTALWMRALDGLPDDVPFLVLPVGKDPADFFRQAQTLRRRVYLVTPVLPGGSDLTEWAEYRAFLRRHGWVERHPFFQRLAYGAARLFVEGLRRSGRALRRERLVEALEKVYGLNTGVLPPLGYGPGRRVGALGAYVFQMDPRHPTWIRVSDWVGVP